MPHRGEASKAKARLLVTAIGAVFALLVPSAPALAAPEWGVTMTHANAYGLQAPECPTGKEEYFPAEPGKDCGVDPYTGSGATFDRESGFNAYTITVKNTGDEATGTIVGKRLTCETGEWRGEPTFTYQWLRDGVAISGANSSTYSLTGTDEGKAIQCQVTGSDAGGATNFLSGSLVVSPEPPTTPPVSTRPPEVSEQFTTIAVGEERTCTSGEWSGSPTAFVYQWLRNGVAIAGANSGSTTATTDSYIATAEDEGASLQCEVTATNAAGSVVATDYFPVLVEPAVSEFPPYTEGAPGPAIQGTGSGNAKVSVSDQLPSGLVLAGEEATGSASNSEVSGSGWSCTVANPSTVTCARSDALAPGASYPPITLHVHVNPTAPLGTPPSGGVTNVATVYGGEASPASVSANAPTTIAQVPFGIESFTTSVTNSLGNPFTQAGGHPFAANATFVFNYMPDDAGALKTAGGSPKDIETELPPGFIGDPQAMPQCSPETFALRSQTPCPLPTAVGYIQFSYSQGRIEGGRAQPLPPGFAPTDAIYNLVPAPGHPAAFGFIGGVSEAHFTLDAKVRSDGDYGITISSPYTTTPTLLAASVTFCESGVTQGGFSFFPTFTCAPASPSATPFLTNPGECSGPAPVTMLSADTYENPEAYASMSSYAGAPSGSPSFAGRLGTDGTPNAGSSFVTGCDRLRFEPEAQLAPSSASEGGTTQADEPTGATFDLKVPQTDEAGMNATPELKNATVTLPEGMTVDPSAADGLQACSNAQFGLGSTVEPAEPGACPLASQIGMVKVITPLLEKPLEGQVFLGESECGAGGVCTNTDAEDGHIFRLFLQADSHEQGVVIKLAGKVSSDPTTGRLQATFTQQPQLPFSELLLTFTGGARAPLANPQTCGTFTTTTDLTPWSAPGLGGPSGSEPIAGTPDATPSSSFDVDWNGADGSCPVTMPFSPSFSAGSQTPAAGASSPFAVTFGREDREQDLSGITVSTPPGLLGRIAGIPQCPEAQANAGTCGPESQIGTTTVGAGPGPHPFYLGGRVYLTGPYKDEPFGLSLVTPAVAGPFNLGTVVVRAAIAVNPSTAALTIVSDTLPQFVDGVQLRLRTIHVDVNRPGFVLNPTSCAQQSVGATITAAQGASSSIATPFAVGACQSLTFAPSFSVSTQAKTSKADGASLTVLVRSTAGQANIAKVDLQLPKILPSRLSTLQKACTETQFDTNPAGCPAGSDIGAARAITPILNVPLTGPGYLVSHGGAAFPDVEFVLQGEGVTIVLDGKTDIKKGVTFSKFETVPDAPISLFETVLPEGPHSILTTDIPASARGSLCRQSLAMPTTITAQNGKQIIQSTKIAVTGCAAVKTKPLTRAQKLKRALHVCRAKYKTRAKKAKRVACETLARKRYGPIKKAKRTNRRAK
jgi:hypothetical protein